MLKTKTKSSAVTFAIPTTDTGIDTLLEKEWLLTNTRGGFSSGTILSCNTRRYHGLLTGSMNPPANRILTLSNCLERICFEDKTYEPSNFEFTETLVPEGYRYQTSFRKDTGIHFHYTFPELTFTRSIYLLPDSDTIALIYNFEKVSKPFDFSVRPLIALRDFHSLQHASVQFYTESRQNGIIVYNDNSNTSEVYLHSSDMHFLDDPQWWYNFIYRKDRQRGQDFTENLWSPGSFSCHIDSPGRVVLWGSLQERAESEIDFDIDTIIDSLLITENELTEHFSNKTLKKLSVAASQFIIERTIRGRNTHSILAGYPWFLDWGRDAFISLPGLLLSTRRFQEAANVLKTFAEAIDEGMVPNRFDDYGGSPHYNSIDASLWFIHAAFQYLHYSKNEDFFVEYLLPGIMKIITAYYNGTRFGIKADFDGLISGGDINTQLTWMDAKCDGIAFTPRYGKAVEVNALWYNALKNLSSYCKKQKLDAAGYYSDLANKVSKSFRKAFWNSSCGYLNDCIHPDGTIDNSLRPNQIFAVSLTCSPLSKDQKEMVVAAVEKELLTPYGLRTLSPAHEKYRAVYTGNQFDRDSAYHNGTVWPFLIGHYFEAYLKINNSSKESIKKVRKCMQPLLSHFETDACIGNISEIFDAEAPHHPRGTFAQAWSIAEILRIMTLIEEAPPLKAKHKPT